MTDQSTSDKYKHFVASLIIGRKARLRPTSNDTAASRRHQDGIRKLKSNETLRTKVNDNRSDHRLKINEIKLHYALKAKLLSRCTIAETEHLCRGKTDF